MAKAKKVYTIAEAAKKMRVTRATLFKAIAEGRLKERQGTFVVTRVVKTKMRGLVLTAEDLKKFKVSERHRAAGKKTPDDD